MNTNCTHERFSQRGYPVHLKKHGWGPSGFPTRNLVGGTVLKQAHLEKMVQLRPAGKSTSDHEAGKIGTAAKGFKLENTPSAAKCMAISNTKSEAFTRYLERGHGERGACRQVHEVSLSSSWLFDRCLLPTEYNTERKYRGQCGDIITPATVLSRSPTNALRELY